jgi:hypothetical protein
VLENLPADRAIATGRALLADPQVTRKCKVRYLQSLCDRGDPEVLAALRDVASEGIVDRELRVTMAYAACGSRAFYLDQAAYAAAGAPDEGDLRAGIRERYLRRLEAAESLVDAAVPQDASSGALLTNLHGRLADKRRSVPGTR